MIFSKLFTPEWKHKNIEVRRRALQALDRETDEAKQIFVEVAKTDQQNSIRQLAIQQLTDIDILLALFNDPEMSDMQETATHRLVEILCDETQTGIPLDERMRRLETIQEQRIVEQVAQQAKELVLRLAALTGVNRQGLLGDLALTDPELKVREQALSQISQRSTLERVAKESRRQDKKINSMAEVRLTKIREETERPKRIKAEAKRLCLSMENLEQSAQKYKLWLSKEDSYLRLCEKWEINLAGWRPEQDGPWNQELTQRFEKKYQEYLTPLKKQRADNQVRLEKEALLAPILEEKLQIITSLESALNNLKKYAQPKENDEASINVLLDSCNTRWQDTVDLPDDQERKLKQRYITAHETLYEWLTDITRYQSANDQLETLTKKASAMCASEADPQHKVLIKLEQTWQSVNKPRHFQLPEETISELITNIEQLKQRVQKAQQQHQAMLNEFKALLKPLEKALSDGKFKHASNLAQRGQKLLKTFSERDIKELKNGKDYARFQNVMNKVRELQGWRNWSNLPARVQLCENIEKLEQQVTSNINTIDYNSVMQRIKEARKEWKRYDTKEVDETSDLWHRFDQACTKCFSSAQAHFDEVHHSQQASKVQREDVCKHLEDFYAEKINGQEVEAVDWKAVENIIRVAETEWRQLGIIPHREWGAVNKRYHNIIRKLRNGLRLDREHNKKAKQLLIKHAQNVIATLDDGKTDLSQAIDKIKTLQAQWKEIGHSEKDRKMWREFNDICHTVFDKRKAQRDAYRCELDNNLQQKEQICEQIEQMARLHGEELKLARAELDQHIQQWNKIGQAPKSHEAKVEERFKCACKGFEESIKKCFEAEREAQHVSLKRKVELCLNLEQLLNEVVTKRLAISDLPQALAPLQEQWSTHTPIPTSDEKWLQQRYQKTQDYFAAINGQDFDAVVALVEREKSENLAKKLELCLQLEILSGSDSPPEYKQARMEYQVAMLAKKMRSGEHNDKTIAAHKIEQQWHEIGVIPEDQVTHLEERFKKASQTI